MHRYPVLLLVIVNAIGLVVAWRVAARFGLAAGIAVYGLTIAALIFIIARLARSKSSPGTE